MALAIFFVTAGPSGVPLGPHRLNRNGGVAPAASRAGPVPREPEASTSSRSAPERPPACAPSTPSPSMKNVSDPWCSAMLRT
jgi:hypothetical protein